MDVEARVFRGWWDDGQLDLFFGIGAVGVAAFWAAGLVALGAIVPAVLAALWTPVRKGLVESRAGWVEFSAERQARNRSRLAGTLAIGVGILALVVVVMPLVADGKLDPVGDLAAGIPAALIGLLAALVALGLGSGRFAWYAAVFVVLGAGVGLAGYAPEVAMFAGGIVVIVAGTRLFIRFRRRTGVHR